MERAKEDIKERAKVRMEKVEARRAPRACSKAKDHAKASRVDPLQPRALRSFSYRHRLMGHPRSRPQAQLMSPATSVTRRVITSPNALNGSRFGHPQLISKRDGRFLDWV